MRLEDHERRREQKRKEFTEKLGLPDAKVIDLDKIIEDCNSDYRAALDPQSVPASYDEDQAYKHISDRLEAASQRALERIKQLSPNLDEAVILLFLGHQMDSETVVARASFHKRHEARIQESFADAVKTVATQKAP
jgi:hypothetical protein